MRTCVSRVCLFASLRVDGVEIAKLSVGRDAVDAFIGDAALNVVAEQREDRQQARQQLRERVVERAAERGHDGGPRARAGAAERVALVLRVVFRIRRRGRRRRLHLQMEAGCAFWPNSGMGGSRAARFCAAGEGLPVSRCASASAQTRAARWVCCVQLDLLSCERRHISIE